MSPERVTIVALDRLINPAAATDWESMAVNSNKMNVRLFNGLVPRVSALRVMRAIANVSSDRRTVCVEQQ